jgi:hypothetical protein
MQDDAVQAQIAGTGDSDGEDVEPALESCEPTPTYAEQGAIEGAAV